LEDIMDSSGRVVQRAPLEIWANLKQRALDVALKEINKQSDIHLELDFIGRGAFRKALSLGFRITARKPRPNRGQARPSAVRLKVENGHRSTTMS
jgi:hypothetical protein